MPWSWYIASLLFTVSLYVALTGTGWLSVCAALFCAVLFLAYITRNYSHERMQDMTEDTSCNQ